MGNESAARGHTDSTDLHTCGDSGSAAQGHKHVWIRRLPGVHRVICETCGVEKPVKR